MVTIMLKKTRPSLLFFITTQSVVNILLFSAFVFLNRFYHHFGHVKWHTPAITYIYFVAPIILTIIINMIFMSLFYD